MYALTWSPSNLADCDIMKNIAPWPSIHPAAESGTDLTVAGTSSLLLQKRIGWNRALSSQIPWASRTHHSQHYLRVCQKHAISRGGYRGAIGAIAPQKSYANNFIHHYFVQFGKQYSRYKAISSSFVLSQQCCEAYFVSLTVANPLWDLTTKHYWNRPPSWILPWFFLDRKTEKPSNGNVCRYNDMNNSISAASDNMSNI